MHHSRDIFGARQLRTKFCQTLDNMPNHSHFFVCCEEDYIPKGKCKSFNSLFHSVYLVYFFSERLFSIADLFAVRYLWVVCNEDKCCVVTRCAADIRVAWLVYVRMYCVPIATLNQNNE